MFVVLVLVSAGALVGGQRTGSEGKTFPWLGGNNNGGGYRPGGGGGYNNNKPGACPSNYGRKKRSALGSFTGTSGRDRYNNGGYNNGGYSNGGYNNGGYNNGGYNNGGYNNGQYGNGGQGYNPGYNGGQGNYPGNNGGYGGRCIRDSECPGAQKCCYYSGGSYQCTQPTYYG